MMALLVVVFLLSFAQVSFSYSCSPVGNGNMLCRLSITEDVFVYDSTNQNHYNFLIVGLHPRYPLKRTLLKFEDIPKTCQKIQTATMYVHYWYAHKASFMSEAQVPWIPRPIEARQVLKSWRETQVTRDVRFSNAPWSQSYLGLHNADTRSSIDDIQTVSRSTTRGYIPWSITATAKNWQAGQPNNGILLSASNEDVLGREIRFYSREWAKNVAPYLEVLCTPNGECLIAKVPGQHVTVRITVCWSKLINTDDLVATEGIWHTWVN